MASLLTNPPNLTIPFPIRIFENEILLSIVLWSILIVFMIYHQWKKIESEQKSEPSETISTTSQSARDILKKAILSLSPDAVNFWDELSKLLRDYIWENLEIQLSPTQTVEQLQEKLPQELWNVFVKIRDIRYAPKWYHSKTCIQVQTYILELIEQHAI